MRRTYPLLVARLLLLLLLSRSVLPPRPARAAADDPDAEICAGRRALLAAAAWSLAASDGADAAVTVDRLVERGLLPKRILCGDVGTYAVELARDAAIARCARHGETKLPRPAAGDDPLAPFKRGCYDAQRSLEVAIGLYVIERPADGTTTPAVDAVCRKVGAATPRCPAGGRLSIGDAGGTLYPDCTLHGPLSVAGEPPAAKPGAAMPALKPLETAEGRAKVCAENLKTIEGAVERVCGDVHVTDGTQFKLDLLVETGYLKFRPACPDGGEYRIDNEHPMITISCPKHGKRQLAY